MDHGRLADSDDGGPNRRSRDTVLIGFALTFVVLAVGAVLGVVNTRRLSENERLVAHTHQVIGGLENLLSTLKDAETGQQAFLLTGDESRLRHYDEALRREESIFERLRELTSDNPDQQARISELKPKIDARVDILKRTVARARSGDRAGAVEIVREGRGLGLMEEIRDRSDVFRRTEEDLLRSRASQSRASFLASNLSIVLPALIAGLLVVVVHSLNRRNQLRRERAKQAFAEQADLMRTTLASIGDGVVTTDVNGDVTNMNAVAEDLTGWRVEDALGQPLTTVFRIVNEQTREEVDNPALRALREGVVVGLANHTVLLAKDGTERPIDDSAAPIRRKLGQIVGSVLVFRDVSERRRTELAREERTRLATLRADVGASLASLRSTSDGLHACCEALVRHLDAAGVRVWTQDEESAGPEARAGAGLGTGWDGLRGELGIDGIARSRDPRIARDLKLAPDSHDAAWAEREGVTAFAGYPLVVEERVVGVLAMFFRRAIAETVLVELPQLAGLIAQYIDRRRAEAVLNESEQFNRGLMNSSADCVKVLDLHGRLMQMNAPGLCLMEIDDFGPFCGRIWSTMWPSESTSEVERAVESARRGETRSFQAFAPTAKGTPRWWDVVVSPVRDGADGRVTRLLSVSRDVTERKRMEDELRQLAANLSEADRRKDEFLATLAHELRNPLAPLRNGLQVMRLSSGRPEAVEPARAMMERQLAQLIRLVDDLMDVSRITKGKIELRRERVQLVDVVNSAVETNRPMMEEMGHELTVTTPMESIIVDADPTRLAQVFLNLLNNAAKYTERNGRIELVVERVGNEATVTVKDEGVGIAADQLPRIFDMFMQVDRSLERARGGLGIGLTLVRRLVEKHGGTIEVRSEGPGRGSEFAVRLPVLVGGTAPTTVVEPVTDVPKSSLRILIVDDNRDGADSLGMMLRIMGNEIRNAYDGMEGLRLAGSFRPEVVLLDIGLPKLNGYEACRRIREQPWGASVVLIAMTGWGQDEDRRLSREAGFDHHMVKPVDPESLMRMLAELRVGER